eukprot:gene20537-22556_t
MSTRSNRLLRNSISAESDHGQWYIVESYNDDVNQEGWKQTESEANLLEMQLRQEIESMQRAESKLLQRYEETENTLATEIADKSECILKIKSLESRIQALENQLEYTEDEKADLEMRLSSLNTVLRRCMGGVVGNRRGKKVTPMSASSPMKDCVDDDTESGFSFDDDLEVNPRYIERMMRDLYDEIKQSEQDKEDLLNDLKTTEMTVSRLQNEVKSLQQKIDEGDKALQASERAKERIELQFERTQETIRLQEKDISRKDVELREIIDRVTGLEKDLKRKESEYNESQNTLDRMGNDSARHAEEKNMLRNQIDKYEVKYRKLEKIKKKMEEEMRKLSDHKEDLLLEKQALKDQMDGLIEDNKKFAHRVLELEHRSEELMSAVEIARSEKVRMNDDVRMLEEAFGKKEASLKDTQDKYREMKRKLIDKDRICESLEKTIDKLESQLSDCKRSNRELMDKIDYTKGAQHDAEEKVIQLEDEFNRLSRSSRDQSKTIDDLLSKVAMSQSEKRCLEDRLSRTEQDLKTSKAALHALEKSCSRKEADAEKLKKRLQKNEAERSNFERSVAMLTEEKTMIERSLRGLTSENEDLKQSVNMMNRALDETVRKQDRSNSDAAELKMRELELKEERTRMEKIMEEREKEADRRIQNDRFARLEDEITTLRQRLAIEQNDRQRIEDIYTRKDDEIDRLRTSFDRSLNTITGDTRNLKTILDKSLHKLDKHIMSSQGLAVTESDVTSTDESYDVSKSKSRLSDKMPDYASISTKLDKYRPVREEKKPMNGDGLARRSSPTRRTSPARRTMKEQSPMRKSTGKQPAERKRVNNYELKTIASSNRDNNIPLKVSSSKRVGRY